MAPEGTETTGSPSGDVGGGGDAGGGDTQAAGGGGDTTAGGAGADTVGGGGGADALDLARAAKPDKADGYALNFSDAAKAQLGDLTGDPAVQAVREHALAKGWTQGEFDDRITETLNVLAEKGLLAPSFDAAAEVAKLSEGGLNGKGRQQDVEVFAKNLQTRGEIDQDLYNELVSLAPTAAGVRLVEYFRKEMGAKGEIQLPPGDGQINVAEAKAQAKSMRQDPRYETDPKFRAETDRLAMQSYGRK